MKTSPLDPEVPAQPLSQCLELPLPVAWTEAAGVRWVGEGELSSRLCAAQGLWLEIRTTMETRRCGGRTNRKRRWRKLLYKDLLKARCLLVTVAHLG